MASCFAVITRTHRRSPETLLSVTVMSGIFSQACEGISKGVKYTFPKLWNRPKRCQAHFPKAMKPSPKMLGTLSQGWETIPNDVDLTFPRLGNRPQRCRTHFPDVGKVSTRKRIILSQDWEGILKDVGHTFRNAAKPCPTRQKLSPERSSAFIFEIASSERGLCLLSK